MDIFDKNLSAMTDYSDYYAQFYNPSSNTTSVDELRREVDNQKTRYTNFLNEMHEGAGYQEATMIASKFLNYNILTNEIRSDISQKDIDNKLDLLYNMNLEWGLTPGT